MRKGDYYNLAQLLGKTHLEYVSPLNASILRTPDGSLPDWNHVNFVGDVQVDLQVMLCPESKNLGHSRNHRAIAPYDCAKSMFLYLARVKPCSKLYPLLCGC